MTKRDWLSISIILLLFYLLFRQLDPLEMLIGDVTPWDSWHYKSTSNQLIANGIIGLGGERPFCYRLLQPALASGIRMGFAATFVQAAHLLNIVSTYLVTLFCFAFWRGLGLIKPLCYGGIVLLSTLWLGPLRYSLVYPGGQFAFEILVTCAAFWALYQLYSASNRANFGLSALALFVATLARENVLYIAIVSVAVLSTLAILQKRHNTLAGIVALTSTLSGFALVRHLFNCDGDYNIFDTVVLYGTFHLNVAETLYMMFFSLGPFFLATILCLSFPATRGELARLLRSQQALKINLAASFCLASFLFAFFAGTDSDRFLLWSLPFYFYFGLASFSVLIVSLRQRWLRRVVLCSFIVVAALWSRFYVPAIPHLLFTTKFNAQDGVKTNLNPQLFKGIPWILPFREEIVEIPASEAFDSEKVGSAKGFPRAYLSRHLADYYLRDPDQQDRPVSEGSPFRGSYRSAANLIPFPLGYAHNQHDLLAIHPFHGNPRLRLFLLMQWVAIYFGMLALISRGLSGRRSAAPSLHAPD